MRLSLDIGLGSVATLKVGGVPPWFTDAPNFASFRQDLRSRLDGASTQLAIDLGLGDSWIHGGNYGDNYDKWTQTLGASLLAKYQDGGLGFCGAGYRTDSIGQRNNSIRPSEFYVVSSTGWTAGDANYYGQGSATTSRLICTAPDLPLIFQVAAGQTVSRLLAVANGVVMRYRYDSGAWTNLTLTTDGSVMKWWDLATPPTTAHTLSIEFVSGTTLAVDGVFYKSAENGLIINKLGNTGGRIATWRGVSSSGYGNSVAGLASNCRFYNGTTNDQVFGAVASGTDVTLSALEGYFIDLIDRDQAAVPGMAQVWIQPCENDRVVGPLAGQNKWTMDEAEAVLRPVAIAKGVAWVSCNGFMTLADMNVGDPHPSFASGRLKIAANVQRVMELPAAA